MCFAGIVPGVWVAEVPLQSRRLTPRQTRLAGRNGQITPSPGKLWRLPPGEGVLPFQGSEMHQVEVHDRVMPNTVSIFCHTCGVSFSEGYAGLDALILFLRTHEVI